MTNRLVLTVVSILISLLSTWGTGIFSAPFSQIQIDVVNYGAPLPYFQRVIPTHFVSYDWLNLALDLAFWAIITYLILAIVLRTSPSKNT
jgi:hypothetical protein